MNCPHLTSDSACALGLYGGSPRPINCLACITQGNNNPDFVAALFATRERSHPPTASPVSGCCDDARNPPT